MGKVIRTMAEPDAILTALDERVRKIAEEVVRGLDVTPARPAPANILDEKAQREVQEQILISHKSYLTRAEVAKYLGVSERSVAEWSARPLDQNPFPAAYAGGDPRYRRAAVDEWAVAEARRQRMRLAG